MESKLKGSKLKLAMCKVNLASPLSVSALRFAMGLALAILMCASSLFAQNPNKVRADESYSRLAYATAIPLYLKALKHDYDPDAVVKLADCYRLTNNYAKASEWYRKVMLLAEKPAINYFYYGHVLLQEGDHAGARQQFAQFAKLAPEDPRGPAFVKALEDLQSLLKDSAMVRIENLPYNSSSSDFGAFPYEGGIVFSSSRNNSAPLRQDFQWLDQPYLDLFHVAQDSAKGWRKPTMLPAAINTRYHESNFFVQPGTQSAYFTRNNFYKNDKGKSSQGVILLETYIAEMNGLNVGSVTPFTWNNNEYSVGHACLAADGKTLYFVSDMPGGQGGKDLYSCKKQGTGWSQPRNLGPGINTLGDEMFPFVYGDGTLFFSSNGHPGLGHLDIFATNLADSSGTVRNLGYPINTAYDDFAYMLSADGIRGYLSSNRPGGKGDDDVYSFKVEGVKVEILVRDKIAHLPIENAMIRVVDEGSGDVVEYVTDSTGHILFTTYTDREFMSTVKTVEFDPVELPMSTVTNSGQTYFKYLVELYNPPPAIAAVVIDAKTKEKLPGSKAYFINIAGRDTTLRVADRNGRFAIKLGKKASYDLIVTHPGYLVYSDRVETEMTQYTGDTVIPLEMEMIRLNEAIVLKNIHYDFDKWYIRDDAVPDLMRLVKLMRDNPSIRIELSSHTDCRGSDEYNRVLSQKRAYSAVAFLIDQDIDSTRIVPMGYGESRLVNGCDDGVPCDENRHYANRRTEFAIIGFMDDQGERQLLSTKEDPNAPPKYVPEAGREWFNKPTLPELTYGQGKYRILAAVFDHKLAPVDLLPFFEYSDQVVAVEAFGKYKYYVGDYANPANADRALRHLKTYGWKNASVVTVE